LRSERREEESGKRRSKYWGGGGGGYWWCLEGRCLLVTIIGCDIMRYGVRRLIPFAFNLSFPKNHAFLATVRDRLL